MRKKVINLIFLFCSSLVLTGCVESRILDELTMVTAMGFDINENGDKIIGTINIPVFQKDEPPRNSIISAQAELQKSILQIMQESSSNQIAMGSLEVLLFGKELTKKMGILDLIDPFTRDPTIGTAMNLAVVDGEVKDLLNGNYGVRGNAFFISKSIDTAVEHGNLPMTNFHRFLIDFYSQGKTPYVPLVFLDMES